MVMVSSVLVMDSTPVVRRNPPGTKHEDFFKWPEQSFDEMDSTLVVQQYIQQMIRRDFTNVEAILDIPVGQDEGVWKYEQLRQFCLELNGLAVCLQNECTPDTCSQMTATEQWIFLCAAHKTPKECPAIDYTRHTLDGAACLLNSNKYFPSRVSIKESSVAKLGSVCRRVYRIFSHAYYHHRHIFDEAENQTYLCRRFTSFVIKYNLMSRDNLIVPILDEASDAPPINQSNNNSVATGDAPPTITLAKKPEPEVGKALGGIASFLNLPEGVVPDDTDEEAVGESLEIDFSSAQLEPEPDDSDAIVDDDFSYSDESGAGYSTLKPVKDAAELKKQNANNSSNVEVANSQEVSLDNTVIQKDTNEEANEDLQSGGDAPVQAENKI